MKILAGVVAAAALVATGCAKEGGVLAPPGMASAGAKAAITLADATRTNLPPAPILIRSGAPAEEAGAAAELARYLTQISDAKFEVKTATSNLPERAILVGPIDIAVPPDVGPDGFIIRTQGQRLHIVGGAPRGTFYGVYGFLEDVAGCRWWSFNDEYVPSARVLRVGELDVTVRPPFAMHDLFNFEAQNSPSNFPYKCRGKSWVQFTGGHTLCPLLKPYAEKNKEFLPMNAKGERAFNDLHMDYSAAGMSEALAEALGAQVEANHRDVTNVIYFAGMGDWYGGMCECPKCKAVYEEETWTDPDGQKKAGYTATLIRMINKTAEILEKKYPGIQVGTFAYMSLEAPPAKTKPRDNVVIWVPRLRHDTVLSILESDKNKSFLRNVEQWCKLAPGRVHIWEYGANFNNFMYPFPCIRSLAENIRLYHKLGVKGVMIQGNYVSTGGDMAALKNYVWRKLMWNPALDTDQVIQEFCRGYYGPASAEILEYVNTLEDSVRKPVQIHADEFADPFKTYLTPALMAQLRQILTRALARTKADDSDPYCRRVQEAMAGIEVAELWKDGPLQERDGQLIRTDLNAYTYPRAQALLNHIRNASPREWGTGRSARMGFLTWQGGPLFKLSQGPVEVKVAPIVNGQLWRVLFKGQEVIQNAQDLLDPGSAYFNPPTQSVANAVAMEAELGVGNWSPDTKQIARKTVSINAEGVIKITGETRVPSAGAGQTSVQVQTPYLAGTSPTGVVVEVSTDNAQWQKVAWAPDKAETPLPAAIKAIRVTLPAKGCAVTDLYVAPKTTGGKLLYDGKAGTLTTSVSLGAVTIAAGTNAVYMDREIRIAPQAK